MLAVSVSDVHRYPIRPKGFEEPLFPTAASKQAVVEHLLEAPWLSRASELAGQRTTGEAAHNLEEVVELRNYCGRVELVRLRGDRRCFRRREWVVKVLDRWREVGRWWDEARYVDRMVFRVLLCGEKVVDLAQERSGDWILVGVAD